MKYYNIDGRNKMVEFFFPFDKEIISEIKDLSFNSHWNPELGYWRVPVDSWSKSRILDFIKKRGFERKLTKEELIEPFDYSISKERAEELRNLCIKRNFTYLPRPYQIEALHYGWERGNFINGSDVGLGKTFEAIIYAEVTDSFPVLVVVPASVKYNWAEKWAEIVGEKRTISVIETKETRKYKRDWTADVVIINYDILGEKKGAGVVPKFAELLKNKWKMFIFDEAHFLKDPTSQRSKVSKKITTKSDAIIQLLTGTPTMSRPLELWNLLVLIKKENMIAENWDKFTLRYCGAYRSKFGLITSGATNTLELNKKMRESCYLRVEKRDVLKDLPDVEKIIFNIPISNKKDIDKATENLYEFLLDTKGEDAADKAMEAETLVSLGVLRKLSIQGKLKGLEQYLKDWKPSGKKLLIFGLHREELEYLSDKFKSKLIAGGISSKDKQKIVKDWIINDEVFLFANITSAGTGVDGLQLVCSNMLIIELPWRPSDLEQVIGRLDRSGQLEPSTIRFMLSNETIDSEMWEMLQEKELNTEAVNKGIDLEKEQSGMKMVLRKLLQNGKNN